MSQAKAPAGAFFPWGLAACQGVAKLTIPATGASGRDSGIADNPPLHLQSGTLLKTFDIEVQRLKSLRHDKGLIEIGVDALVLPRPARDETPTTVVSMPVDQARALMLLLKQQFTELDKLQPRSRRSGRC